MVRLLAPGGIMAHKLLRFKILLPIVLASLLMIGGVVGYFVVNKMRGQGALERAEQAYADENWNEAKTNYTWYLARQEDPEVLPKYIHSCLQLLGNRSANISAAGQGYLKLALANRSDRDQVQQVIDFYRKHGLWRELDYAAGLFLREYPDDPVVDDQPDARVRFLQFNKALASDRLGRTAEATAAYQRLIDAGNAEPEVYGNLARLKQQQNLETQGRQLLDDALAKTPDDPRVHVERAKFALDANDLPLATQEIEAALAAGANTEDAFITAARVRTAHGEWEKAQTLAEQAIAVMPDSAEGYFTVVQSLMARRKTDEAIAFLAAIDPYVMADNPQLYFILVETQINADKLEDADRTLEAFRTACPDKGVYFEYFAARKLGKEGNPAEAASRLEILVENAPDFSEARFALVLAYLDSDQRERARNALEMYITSYPDDNRARFLWDAKNFAKRSTQEIEAAAIALLDSDTPQYHSLISTADSLAQANPEADVNGERRELVKRLYERAIQVSPDTPDGYIRLAGICIQEGAFERVLQLLDSAEGTGVDAMELAIAKAALAVAESRPADAKALFEEELARDAMTPQRATQWAQLFASRDGLQSGLDVLEAVKAREADVGKQQELDLAQVTFCLRSGDIEKSRALVERIDTTYPDEPRMVKRLNDSRMSIARALLVPGDQRDLPAAEALLAAIETAEPGRNDVKIVRARLLLSQDPPDVDGAERLSAEVRKKSDDADPEAFLISSEIASLKGQFDDALEFVEKASTAAPDDGAIAWKLSQAQLQAGRYTEALMTLEKLNTMLPDNPDIMDLLARAYEYAGRSEEAEALARQLAATQDDQEDVSLQALIKISQKDWASASELLRQTLEDKPDDLSSIDLFARAMAAQGQWAELESFFNDCVSRQPDSPNLWVKLGNTYFREPGSEVKLDPERLQKASFAFTQALALQPGFLPALRGLLNVNLQSREFGAALGLCDRYLASAPNDVEMLETKANLLAQLPGRQQEALTSIERAIEITPRIESYYLRGRLLKDLGEFDAEKFGKAFEDYERVRQAKGGALELDIAQAECLLGMKDNERALIYYDSAKTKAANAAPLLAARLDEIAKRLEEEIAKRLEEKED